VSAAVSLRRERPRLAGPPRQVFEVSRVSEFFSEKELTQQLGQPRRLWALALVKELIDNGLDACEKAGIPPEITIRVERDAVTVGDNGPGLPREVLERSLDYRYRVSDNVYYVSPTRGQLGQALKLVWAAPYVDTGRGRVEVTANGQTHVVEVSFDRIGQEPRIGLTDSPAPGLVRNGTSVTMHWTEVAIAHSEPPGASVLTSRSA
jgi:DNA topoisomerase VI subunit B